MKRNLLSVGAARVDITPPIGCDLTGFIGRTSSSLGVLDPLFARAIFIRQQDANQAILISCDLLGLEASFVAVARRAIARETGVPAQSISIACTHTHSGPASMFLRFCGDVDSGYMAELIERLAQVAREAQNAAVPATVSSGTTPVAGISINRRVPGGPIDEDFDLVRFDDEQGKPLAAITSFACHPVAYGGASRLFSAEYPGVLTKCLEDETGAITLFLNGASAQINPNISVAEGQPAPTGLDVIQRMGATLTKAALEMWPKLQQVRASTLAVQSREISLPLQRVDEKMLEPFLIEHAASIASLVPSLPDEVACLGIKGAMAMAEWAWETRDAVRNGTVRKSVAAEVQTLQLGELIFVMVPGEFFLEFGRQIKRALAPRRAILATYANANVGYLATRKAFLEGGYEVMAYRYYGYPSAFSPAAGEKIVAAVKAMHPSKGKEK